MWAMEEQARHEFAGNGLGVGRLSGARASGDRPDPTRAE